MTAPLKDFTDLKSLQQKLKAQEEVRIAEAAERKQRAEQADRDANVFRKSVGNIQPLTSKNK
ncbi:hypothetical protein [Glaciimonas immobilis]|uniref:Uncharacterized protein n=1 Tax=Glaciimonas immobilis TaxID=728004 RepID=A0A840RK82_9BURK|nr:hypothetical protein [Glaciimonas immobilis]KAF3999161.1 hypothetical protein HAV38_04255 [Glaciimonas immobilis]MBB5198607.1 hypothetical protein [Glaciimonas immobilis]